MPLSQNLTAFVVQEKSICQSSITHLMSATLIFQGGPMATWADENSQLAMGKNFQMTFTKFLL